MMRHSFLISSVVGIALSSAGCAGLSLPFVGGSGDIVRATASNPVMDVVTIWEPGEGRGLNNLPSRGLAGQLMFFTYRERPAALIDGDVTLYLFDDQGTTEEQGKPIFQRTFTTAEWNSLGMQTSLGTAYQLFVPYVRKGQHEAQCSVRVKFQPTDGGAPVYSKMSHVTLPGAGSEESVATMRRERIEPKRFDPSLVTDMRSLESESPAEPSQRSLQATTLPYPGQQRVSPLVASRLKQMAQEMVRDQQEQGAIQQTGYVAEPASQVESHETEEANGGRRYRLNR